MDCQFQVTPKSSKIGQNISVKLPILSILLYTQIDKCDWKYIDKCDS